MTAQLSMFPVSQPLTPTQAGIKKAVDHANQVHDGWSEKAYSYLVDFVRIHDGEFMAEDVREKSKGIIPVPPSRRAWGGVIRRAACSGLIQKVGIRSVKNEKAHSANSAMWRAIK